jgi:hypothetical protein
VEIQEKVNAIFNCSGFAIFIKVSGIIVVKNYIHNRLNLKIQMNDEFNLTEENVINPKDVSKFLVLNFENNVVYNEEEGSDLPDS